MHTSSDRDSPSIKMSLYFGRNARNISSIHTSGVQSTEVAFTVVSLSSLYRKFQAIFILEEGGDDHGGIICRISSFLVMESGMTVDLDESCFRYSHFGHLRGFAGTSCTLHISMLHQRLQFDRQYERIMNVQIHKYVYTRITSHRGD